VNTSAAAPADPTTAANPTTAADPTTAANPTTAATSTTAAPPTAGQLSVSSQRIDFGSVTEGTVSNANVTFTNTGSVDVMLSDEAVVGAGFTTMGIGTNLILRPNQSSTLTISFNPLTAGESAGSVTVGSNASQSPITITLVGIGESLDKHHHVVFLSWGPSASPVIGYNVYRTTKPGKGYDLLNDSPIQDTSYTDTTAKNGKSYFYVVTAVDNENVQSDFSNEVAADVPQN
jgi:hypothetical protein